MNFRLRLTALASLGLYDELGKARAAHQKALSGKVLADKKVLLRKFGELT